MWHDKWWKGFMVLVLVLLPACTMSRLPWPVATPAPPLIASLQFTKAATDLGGTAWMEDQALEFGVSLNLGGVYALDHSTAFLYGGVTVPAGTLHSILLRSADKGQHWQEVMERVPASDIWFIDFVDSHRGWALAVWTVEGVGSLTLYQTTDGGLTWKRLADVPKWQWYGYPLNMDFSDALHGQIDLLYDLGLPPDNRIAYLVTSDGGATWLETSSLSLGQDRDREASSTAVAAYENNPLKAISSDGSVWELKTNEAATQYLISRHFETMVQTYTFPAHYRYTETGPYSP